MHACTLSAEQTCFLPLLCYTLPNWLTLILPRTVFIAIQTMPFDFCEDVLIVQTSLGFESSRCWWWPSLGPLLRADLSSIFRVAETFQQALGPQQLFAYYLRVYTKAQRPI